MKSSDENNKVYLSKVCAVPGTESGSDELFIPFPDEMIDKNTLFATHREYHVITENEKILLVPLVRLSRFRRELNKWMKRAEKKNTNVAIYHRNELKAYMVPYIEETFDV